MYVMLDFITKYQQTTSSAKPKHLYKMVQNGTQNILI